MPLDSQERLLIARRKLRSLLHLLDEDQTATFNDGPGSGINNGSIYWVLDDEENLGRTLDRSVLELTNNEHLDLIIFYEDIDAARVASRRANFLHPAPKIYLISEGKKIPVEPALQQIRPKIASVEPTKEFENLCLGADLKTVFESGIWRGEILGLEVVRLSEGKVEVGVGKFDREAGLIMNAGRSLAEVLHAATEIVKSQRQPGKGFHPLSTLVRERWLRSEALLNPSSLDFESMEPIDPPEERLSLRDSASSAAMAKDKDGADVLVIFSVGVDIRIFSFIADLLFLESPDRVEVIMPKKDIFKPITQILNKFVVPISVMGVRGPWEVEDI